MTRRFRLSVFLSLALLASASSAQAQFGYPGGFGGMGWGGWQSSTPQGDYAMGMGFFAQGMGYYNEATARANAINAETALHWNEYWYQAQRERNRRY